MSKGNLFLGQARGSVGDVTFSRMDGKQVARARNRAPKNPRSILQVLQRVCFATASKAYSAMSPIVDHSFEGLAAGTPNQSRFLVVNNGLLRDKLADIIAYPDLDKLYGSTAANYSLRGAPKPVLNEYVISEGSLPAVAIEPIDDGTGIIFAEDLVPVGVLPTYAEVVNVLGLQRGDQLTFCGLAHNFTSYAQGTEPYEYINGFEFARVILEPASGDMSTNFITNSGTINSPNERNQGSVKFAFESDDEDIRLLEINNVKFGNDGTRTLCYGAIIVSRLGVDGKWLRSSATLIKTTTGDMDTDTIGDAYDSYMYATSSELYLNQAGF